MITDAARKVAEHLKGANLRVPRGMNVYHPDGMRAVLIPFTGMEAFDEQQLVEAVKGELAGHNAEVVGLTPELAEFFEKRTLSPPPEYPRGRYPIGARYLEIRFPNITRAAEFASALTDHWRHDSAFAPSTGLIRRQSPTEALHQSTERYLEEMLQEAKLKEQRRKERIQIQLEESGMTLREKIQRALDNSSEAASPEDRSVQILNAAAEAILEHQKLSHDDGATIGFKHAQTTLGYLLRATDYADFQRRRADAEAKFPKTIGTLLPEISQTHKVLELLGAHAESHPNGAQLALRIAEIRKSLSEIYRKENTVDPLSFYTRKPRKKATK